MKGARALGLRPLVLLLLAGMISLNGAIAWLGHLDAKAAAAMAAAEQQRLESFRLAEHMRVSSNDMTRLARLYLLTGEPRFFDYYGEIVAIRNGTAPRPVRYDSAFWMHVIAAGKAGVAYGPPQSLRDLLRAQGVTEAEVVALEASREMSDRLGDIEVAAMQERMRRAQAARRPLQPAELADLQLRVADADYNRRKSEILSAVDTFTQLVDARIQHSVDAAQGRSAALRRGQTVLFFGVIGFGALVLLIAERFGVGPLRRLVEATEAFQQGRYDVRVDNSTSVAELRQLAGAFNQMAGAVQGDVERHRQLQRDIALSRDELQERNALFGKLCDAVDVVFWIGETDFSRWRYVNPAYERLWGWAVADLYRDPGLFLRSVHPDDVDVVVKAMTAAGAGGEANIEYRVRTRAGAERWVWSRAFGARDASGKVMFTTGTTTDITHRKETELNLAERTRELAEALARAADSEARFRIMAEAVDVIIWIAEPDLSRFRYINPAFERLLGWTAEELYADPGAMIKTLCQEDTPIVTEALGRAAAGGEADFEYRAYTRSGEMRWLWTRAFAARDASGKVTFVAGTSTDMTARKQLDAQLREREQEAREAAQRLRGLTDNAPSLLWEARQSAPGEQVRFSYLSRGAQNFYHPHTSADMLRDSNLWLEAVHPDDRPRLVEEINRTTHERRPRFACEYRSRRPDGTYRWAHTVSAQVPDPANGGMVNYGFTSDIHEQKALQEELAAAREQAEAANHAKSTFLATMSHEIRTPMIGVTGMLEILSQTRLNAEQRRAVNVVQQSAQSLLQIIGDILDFSKIEAGKLELAPTTVSLPELVESVAQNFVPPASSKGLRLTAEVDPALASAHRADPVRLRQILSNFLSNALKFTEQGSISLSARPVGAQAATQTVEFSVTDTGIGVSEENQRNLFQPFAQGDSATTRRFGGTGLGLSICRRLADLMGGVITMESRLGAGTTMRLRVTLDVGDPAHIEALTQRVPPRIAGRRPLSRKSALAEGSLLLLVEDHATNRLVLTEQLALAGFTLDVAPDGERALALWRKTRYGLVLTDLHMPKMDGIALTRAIRAAERQEGRARVPIVALTAAALRDESERCLEAGMDDIVLKPTTAPQLATKLRQWLPALPWEETDVPAQPPAPAPRDGFDAAALAALAPGNDGMLRRIVADFQQATEQDLAALSAAIERVDAAAVVRHAHRIRGASGIVGATEMSGISARIESAGQRADWAALRALHPELAEAFQRLRPRLLAMGEAGGRGRIA
jgi:PAS domain S-box-containing protein